LLPKLEASRIEQIDNKATASMILSTKADTDLFFLFFIVPRGEIGGLSARE
jgi:hypothetical protein